MGHVTDDYTPLQRDFDTFCGFYGGAIGYFDSTSKHNDLTGYDFHKNSNRWKPDSDGYTYNMYAYHDRVIELLDLEAENENENENDKPFFLYIGWQGSHTPSEAPDTFKQYYQTSSTGEEEDDEDNNNDATQKDDKRVAFQAQTTLTDKLFESIVAKLKSENIWDNTLIIFTSDNGAMLGYGDNSPLRGGKSTLWEGGIRVPAFVTGGVLPEDKRGKIMNDYAMHITDWYPTVLSAAGLDTLSPNTLDGKNMWPVLVGNYNEELELDLESLGSTREILINVDSNDCRNEVCGSLIYGGKWKILISSNQVSEEESSGSLGCWWERSFAIDSNNDIFGCNGIPSSIDTSSGCSCTNTVCLFDLENDPCEYFDVSEEYDDITQELYKKLVLYYNEQTETLFNYFDDVDDNIINPDNFGGYWEPFYDSNEYTIDNLEFEVLLSKYYEYQPDIVSPDKDKDQVPQDQDKEIEQVGNLKKDKRDKLSSTKRKKEEKKNKHQVLYKTKILHVFFFVVLAILFFWCFIIVTACV